MSYTLKLILCALLAPVLFIGEALRALLVPLAMLIPAMLAPIDHIIAQALARMAERKRIDPVQRARFLAYIARACRHDRFTSGYFLPC